MGTLEAEGSVIHLWGSPFPSLDGGRRGWCNFCGFPRPVIPASTRSWGVRGVVRVRLGLLLRRGGFVTLTVTSGAAPSPELVPCAHVRHSAAPLASWSELSRALSQPCGPEGPWGGAWREECPGPWGDR